jgi:carbamoyltransferase
MRVLGVNSIFRDPAAALVVGGRVLVASDEERMSPSGYGKRSTRLSALERPEAWARRVLCRGAVRADELDALAYTYDPDVAPGVESEPHDHEKEARRIALMRRTPAFLGSVFPGLDPSIVRYVPYDVARAAAGYLAVPDRDCAVLVVDVRGRRLSCLAGVVRGGSLEVLRRGFAPIERDLLSWLYERSGADTLVLAGDAATPAAAECFGSYRSPFAHVRVEQPTGDGSAALGAALFVAAASGDAIAAPTSDRFAIRRAS